MRKIYYEIPQYKKYFGVLESGVCGFCLVYLAQYHVGLYLFFFQVFLEHLLDVIHGADSFI